MSIMPTLRINQGNNKNIGKSRKKFIFKSQAYNNNIIEIRAQIESIIVKVTLFSYGKLEKIDKKNK